MTGRLITLAGPIGSGKTVLTGILAEALGARAVYEPVEDNPVIDDFYRGNAIAAARRAAGDPHARNPYAFLMQIYLLTRRYAALKAARRAGRDEPGRPGRDSVLDRSIEEDRVFMALNRDRGNVSGTEWSTYDALFTTLVEDLDDAPFRRAPDLMVVITVSFPTMMRHIRKRGRPFEQLDADPDLEGYYRDLLAHYAHWRRTYGDSPVLDIDGDRLDFEGDPADRARVVTRVREALAGTR